jgi:hypothetical protein
VLVGCRGADDPPDGAGGSAGAPATECAPGEVPLEQGGCRAPGVPPDGCGEGFTYDGNGACTAIVPASACPLGQMATVGETACREVAPCGAAPWGDIVTDAATQFVDRSFVGASTGSESAPWTTIQQAIDMVADGGMVAIAEGSYPESLYIDKPVRIWGRCPSLVEIAGDDTSIVTINSGANVELHTLAIAGSGVGITAFYSDALLFDRLWVHDTTGSGMALNYGSATLEGVLIEEVPTAGIYAQSAALKITGTVFRNMHADAASRGEAIALVKAMPPRAMLEMSQSIIEGAAGVGLLTLGADATLDSTLVRDTQPLPDGSFGFGALIANAADNDPSNVRFTRSVFERNQGVGAMVSAAALVVETTTVRDTQPMVVPHPSGFDFGFGLTAQDHLTTGQRAQLTVSSSTIERNEGVGIQVVASDVVIEASVVRDTKPQSSDGLLGRGINAQPNPGTMQLPNMTMRHAAVERCAEVGISIAGSTFAIESIAVRDIQPQPGNGTLGRGITLQDDAATQARSTGTLVDAVVERTFEGGLFLISADATLERLLVSDAQARATDGAFGDGIVVMSYASIANATLIETTIRQSGRAGISNFGAVLSLSDSTSECNLIHLDGELYQGTKDYTFDDGGNNRCGCDGTWEPCKVVSTQLTAPDPLPPGPGQ